MEIKEIVMLAQSVTGFTLGVMRESKGGNAQKARYVLIMLLLEEGYSKRFISQKLEIPKSTVFSNQVAFKYRIDTDQVLKKMYLQSVQALAEREYSREGAA